MRFAVLSDIQGNATALRAVLERIPEEHERVERIFSIGDAVGLGPEPNEVVDILREQRIDAVRGNYDDAIAFERIGSGMDFATAAREMADHTALEWTRRTLTDENLKYIRSWPRDIRLTGGSGRIVELTKDTEDEAASQYRKTFLLRALFGGAAGGMSRQRGIPSKSVLMVHGSPRALNEFIRPDTARSILDTIAQGANADVLISGHAGVQFQRTVDARTYIGVAGVSGPSTPVGLATYAVITVANEITAEFGETTYDAGAYLAAMREAGLEPILT